MALHHAQRLQIEDTFRDLKNHRHGFGLHSARTCDPKRRETLLLIATLAMLILWLTGLAAKAKDWSRYFQVNTERKRDVLSIFFLGWQVLRKTQFRITQTDLITARNWLPEIAM